MVALLRLDLTAALGVYYLVHTISTRRPTPLLDVGRAAFRKRLVFVDLRATCRPQNRHPGNASALKSHLHTACHLILCRGPPPGLSPHGPLLVLY